MLRTFIAVRIPETRELRALHRRLAELPGLRPLPTGNLHLTLKFLGDTPDTSVAEIARAVERTAAGVATWQGTLRGMGAFPHIRRPSAVWVGVADEGLLAGLAASLDRELAPLGFAPEGRAFQPHVTLLRLRKRPPDELFDIVEELKDAEFGTVAIESVEYLQSELQPGGSRYTLLAKAPLGERGTSSP
jgi:2'-5' RNA ligase